MKKSFKELDLDLCYDSGYEDIIEKFFIPVLESSVQYDRIAGFFSSSSLAVAAKGIAGLISNKGKMRLLASPRLSKADAEALSNVIKDPSIYQGQGIDLSIDSIEDEFVLNHVKALGWLVANEYLEIKLVIVTKNDRIYTAEEVEQLGLFHQKVGILTDCENNSMSFSGSINESASAWKYNIEEFKVFPSWMDGSKQYFIKDRNKFEDIWFQRRSDVKVVSIPEALKDHLIEISKNFDIDSIATKEYLRKKKASLADNQVKDISLFPYQKTAIEKWLLNNKRLLFEMATGTGKTRTAIGAALKTLNDFPLLIIIATPQNTLSLQWKSDIEFLRIVFERSIVVDSTNTKWRKDLKKSIIDIHLSYIKNVVVYTTHDTCSSDDFIEIISSINHSVRILFIGDECHGLGAPKRRKGLLDIYNFRIGLSATPSRWFDDEGSKIILDYFGQSNFEFSIKDALTEFNPITNKHFLVNYYFYIEKTSLTPEEAEEYTDLSQKIYKLYSKEDKNQNEIERLNKFFRDRANIVKNATNKYTCLNDILSKISELPGGIRDTIIFVSPEQLDTVQDMLYERNIMYHKLTENEGTVPLLQFNNLTERQSIIEKFKSGDFQVLIAIKCLDEGVDIPTASKGILMASSTNPRQYIQRIGRIIRQSPNKEYAYLFDITVNSLDENLEVEEKVVEKKIREKEIVRLREIAENALNKFEAVSTINSLI